MGIVIETRFSHRVHHASHASHVTLASGRTRLVGGLHTPTYILPEPRKNRIRSPLQLVLSQWYKSHSPPESTRPPLLCNLLVCGLLFSFPCLNSPPAPPRNGDVSIVTFLSLPCSPSPSAAFIYTWTMSLAGVITSLTSLGLH